MHVDQVDITADVVAGLVADQFPRWASHAVRPVASYGTVNALFRLGEDIVLRFPLQPGPGTDHRQALLDEQSHARRFAPALPVAVPEPLGIGEPGPGYAGPWTAYRWIRGETASAATISDPEVFARDLARAVEALHGIDTAGRTWDGSSRGGPLRTEDAFVRQNMAQSGRWVDIRRLTAVWETCLAAADDDGPGVWLHGDLMPGNMLVRDGRLAAVIDLGAVAVGDAALDLMPAWNLLPPRARVAYRRALGVDDAAWERGRGWAVVQAIGCVPYYVGTNRVMFETARRTLAAVLE